MRLVIPTLLAVGCAADPAPTSSTPAAVSSTVGPVTLARDLPDPSALVAHGDLLFVASYGDDFGDGGRLLRIPKAGGASLELASTHGITAVARDGTTLFWGGDNKIGRVNEDGTDKHILVDGGAAVDGSLVVDATNVYWVTTAGELRRVARAGGTPVTVVSEGLNA